MDTKQIDQVLNSLNKSEFDLSSNDKLLIENKLQEYFQSQTSINRQNISTNTKAKNYFSKISNKITESSEDTQPEPSPQLLKESIQNLNEKVLK
jgi:hypothetical protein